MIPLGLIPDVLIDAIAAIDALLRLRVGDVIVIAIPFQCRSNLMSETAIAMGAKLDPEYSPDHGDLGILTAKGQGWVTVDFGICGWEHIDVHPLRLESLGSL